MTDTLAGWLALREGADAAARSVRITQALADTVAGRECVRVLDLGTGTGANARYLVPHLGRHQQWLTTDRDVTLLELLPTRMASWAESHGFRLDGGPEGCTIRGPELTCEIDMRALDLGSLDDAALFTGRHVVTASALLDLTSAPWLTTLARRCRAEGAAALFALSYNGWSACAPAEPEDDMVRDLLNRHQRTNTALGGPAAGPEAAAIAARCFADVGYQVQTERSDWTLRSLEHELQRRLVDGWAEAATELMPDAAGAIERWRQRRDAHIEANRSMIVVGHVDMAAWLPG